MSALKLLRKISCVVALHFMASGCAVGPRGIPPTAGIPNFAKVDPHLYRGAQPDRAGLRSLHEKGVGTIINLRAPGDGWTDEKAVAASEGMAYYNVPMSGFLRPKAATVTAVLDLIEKSPTPVFVHCQYGCDRTGTIIASYRVRHDGWKSARALDEARAFGMYPWELGMKGFVRDLETRSKTQTR